MHVKNWNCEGNNCISEHSEIRVLPTGPIDASSGDGMSNALLCKACYNLEIMWRKSRNLELKNPLAFKLPKWEDLRIYDAGS